MDMTVDLSMEDLMLYMGRKRGFTLAEVLITLGIIGVVAALTLPALVANYRKNITVTRMQKFYSVMNQAVRLTSVKANETGDFASIPNVSIPHNAQAMEDWWKEYVGKYVKTGEIKHKNNGIVVSLSDGSGIGLYASGLSENQSLPCENASSCIHVIFCTEYKYCRDSDNILPSTSTAIKTDGKNSFVFHFTGTGLVAYTVGADKNDSNFREILKNNCASGNKNYCARLIQNDGWKIENDYPIKF